MSHMHMLQHTTTHCNTLHHTAILCNTQERIKYGALGFNIPYSFTESDYLICQTQVKMFLEEFDEVCTLQHTATHCTTHYKTLQTHGETLPLTTTHSFPESDYFIFFRRKSRFPSKNSMSYTQRITLQHMVARCNTHCNTHCNTLLSPERLPHLSDASQDVLRGFDKRCSVLQRVAVCRSVLQ